MAPDLRTTLRRLAPSPTRALDLEATIGEGRRRRRVRYAVSGVATIAVMAVSGLAALQVMDAPQQTPSDSVGTPDATSAPTPIPTTPSRVFEKLDPGWTTLRQPPEVRTSAATAWTGRELIVWGGYVYSGFSDETVEGDGFRFDPGSNTWEPIAPSPLQARSDPATAWTGRELLIWGGSQDPDHRSFFGDGAAYDPTTNTWRGLPDAPISARAPLSVWTGRELIVWGVNAINGEVSVDGAAYDPLQDSWRTLPDAPIGLGRATAIWTDREMIVLGDAGERNDGSSLAPAAGIAYDPATDKWRRLADSGLSNNASTASWNGSEMIAWDYLLETAAYDPDTDAWRSLPAVPLEDYECYPKSVAVGDRVFGDYCGTAALYESSSDRWRDVSRRDFAGWGFSLVGADPVVLLLGSSVDTQKEVFVAYRPGE